MRNVGCKIPRNRKEISEHIGIKDRKYLKQILDKMIEKNLIQMTLPNKSTSPQQKYVALNCYQIDTKKNV